MSVKDDILIRETKYRGKPLYFVRELSHRVCDGCCFRQTSTLCPHTEKFGCMENASICVRDLDEHIVRVATYKLTGKLE